MLNPKLETLNSKQTQMSKTENSKPYSLLTHSAAPSPALQGGV